MTPEERWVVEMARPTNDYTYEGVDDPAPAFTSANKLELMLDSVGVNVDGADRIRDQYNSILSQADAIFSSFEEAGVDSMLIKWPQIPRQHGDLDILVPAGVNTAGRILRDAYGYYYEPDDDEYRRKYVGTVNSHSIEVDLHLDAAWVGIRYLDPERLYAHRVKKLVGGYMFPYPNREDDFLIWAAHDMRSNEVLLHTAFHLQEYFSGYLDWEYLATCASEFGWRKQLDAYAGTINHILAEVHRRSPDIDLPYRHPTSRMFKLKLDKLLRDARRDSSAGIEDLRAYLRFDVPELMR